MDFLSQLLRGIAFVPALVNGIEGLVREQVWGGEKRCGYVVPAECALYGRCGGRSRDNRSRKIQDRHLSNYRWHRSVPQCIYLVQTATNHRRSAFCLTT